MKDREPNYNPFLECEAYVSEHGTGAGVRSKYWNIPCTNESAAKKLAVIIRAAYKCGREDIQSEFRKLINAPAWIGEATFDGL